MGRKKAQPTAPVSRSTFDPAIFARILELVTEGATAREACRQVNLTWGTFCKWKGLNEETRGQYALAREAMYEFWADDMVRIARDRSRDVIESETPTEHGKKIERRSDNTAVNRDRLDIDTVKWLLCKLKPERFGDKLAHTGPEGGAIQVEVVISEKRVKN